MVLPNAILALYYGWRRKLEVVYTSQVGDGHICMPLCVGIYALFQPLELPAVFTQGVYLLGGATAVHLTVHWHNGKAATHRGIRAGGSLWVLSESRPAEVSAQLRVDSSEAAHTFSLKSANGTCALNQRGFCAISSIEARVLLQIR
jgi:hypothetical protein